MAIVGYLSYNNSQVALEKSVIEQVSMTAESLEQHLVTYFSEQKNSFEIMSHDGIFSDQTNLLLIQERLDFYVEKLDAFYDLSLLDKFGKVIASTEVLTIGSDKSADAFFTNAKEEPYIKDVYKSPTTGLLGFAVSAPIITNGEFLGVVVGRYKLNGLNAVLETANRGETMKSHLVDSSGLVFTATRFGGENDILTLRGDSLSVKTALSTGEDQSGRNIDYRGKEVLGSFQTSHLQEVLGKKWVLVVEEDVSEAFAPVVALRNQLFMIILIVLATILGLALYASRSVGEFVRKPIRRAVEQMTAAASQLGASTQQTSAASQQNSSIAQQLASGAMQQSRQAEEISKGVSELSAALQQMSAFAQEASASATLSSKMVQKTGEDSEKISEMVETITNIAEQTNMLALNAAIEAARAGEAGRGFAVVADEVRKLAESSGQSADEIKKIVHDIGGSMNETVKSVQDVSKRISEVATAIQQQAAGVTQIAKTMDSIAAVSEQNASGAQQLSASTQQQSAANQQVAAAAQQLQSLSNQLQLLAGGMKDLEKHISSTAAPFMQKNKTTQVAAKPSSEQKAGK